MLSSGATARVERESAVDVLSRAREGDVVTLTIEGAARQRAEKQRLSRAARELGKSLVWLNPPNPRQIAFQVKSLSSLQRALVVSSERRPSAPPVASLAERTVLPDDPFERIIAQHGDVGREIVQLGCALYMPEGFRRFIRIPMPELDGRSALEAADAGDARPVLAVLQKLAGSASADPWRPTLR